MNKIFVVLGISIVFCMLSLSGCQEKGTNAGTSNDKIFFTSDILEITNGSLTLVKAQGGVINKADLVVYFRNKLTQPIYNLTLAMDFCDINNNVLQSFPYEYVTEFPAGYREASPNRFSYTGSDAHAVDHVNIRITHYKV